MLKRNVLTMSFAPRDNHEAQVQFALERGVPAIIGVLGSIKLPYPPRSFDMAQCSRCLIQWGSNGTAITKQPSKFKQVVSCSIFAHLIFIIFSLKILRKIFLIVLYFIKITPDN